MLKLYRNGTAVHATLRITRHTVQHVICNTLHLVCRGFQQSSLLQNAGVDVLRRVAVLQCLILAQCRQERLFVQLLPLLFVPPLLLPEELPELPALFFASVVASCRPAIVL